MWLWKCHEYHINIATHYLYLSCLFGLVVECGTARLSTRPGLISCTGPGCEIRSGTYATGLISWAASEGLTMCSLICDRWLTRKISDVYGFNRSPGVLDSANMTFGCGCNARPTANLWGGGTAVQAGGMSRCTVRLHCLGREHNLGLKSLKQYPLLVPSRLSNAKPVGSHYL